MTIVLMRHSAAGRLFRAAINLSWGNSQDSMTSKRGVLKTKRNKKKHRDFFNEVKTEKGLGESQFYGCYVYRKTVVFNDPLSSDVSSTFPRRPSECIRTGAESAWRIAEKETIEKKRTEDVIDFPGEIVTTSECDYS